ncbi:MAG: ABC transporter ATP-binding protein [Clostridia bacterium]|nr:ABC transporter ATP-binding protein [Clostridia bacterium]
MAVIQTKNLTKFYKKSRGIEDLSFSVEAGECFGFIGPNGAGKSTTIRLLLGLLTPTSGKGEVLGLPLSRSAEYLAEVGYMPGEAIFYNSMRAGEVIAYSAKLRRKDCSAEAKRLMEALEIDPRKKIGELSLGNRKKVSIVCALQHSPALCILDEPTGGLDPLMQKVFFDLLQERRKAGGTVFISSHILSEVEHNCTRAAIIREGRLAAVGNVSELAGSSVKRVTLRGVSTLPHGFAASSVKATDNGITFLYHGSARELITALSSLPIEDLTVTEPELSEVFLHYYEGGKAE